ncbi:hypothetical protein [Agromyces humatus]|uniref:DUF222 domain-containing protein n=1 Tax=Agromyces humatus TaxID=279573 RepID=A0ABN2L2R1_9MICO|nr:hypothetical protein [Agromyces humatus]
MTQETLSETVGEVMVELAALDDAKMREVNERRGDDHGVSLGRLRTLAKRVKTQHDRARAQIGIEHVELRVRAIDIGERLEVLKDHPTPPNCTSPFAPTWIGEMARRQGAA